MWAFGFELSLDASFLAGSPLRSEDLLGQDAQVGSDKVRFGSQGVEHLAWPSDERSFPPHGHCAGEIPRMCSDHYERVWSKTKLPLNHEVGLSCRFEAMCRIRRKDPLEVVVDASTGKLGSRRFEWRVRECDEPKPRFTETFKTVIHVSVRRESAHCLKNLLPLPFGEGFAVARFDNSERGPANRTEIRIGPDDGCDEREFQHLLEPFGAHGGASKAPFKDRGKSGEVKERFVHVKHKDWRHRKHFSPWYALMRYPHAFPGADGHPQTTSSG